MKLNDDVKLIKDNKKYTENGVYKGMIGHIAMAEIRNNCFYVIFIDENFALHENNPRWFAEHYDEIQDDKFCIIKIEDLELVKDNSATDEEILKDLPKQNPKWWCKVENGFITNLLGEKKNKIPYDYRTK